MNATRRRQVDATVERLNVPDTLTREMVRVAKEFRREPTAGEALLWSALRGRALGGRKFRRQQPMGPFVLDFYCASERLAVEVDGGVHDDPEQARLDAERQQLIESLGIRFVRVRDEVVRLDLHAALALISSHFHPSPSPLVGEGRPKAGVRVPRPTDHHRTSGERA